MFVPALGAANTKPAPAASGAPAPAPAGETRHPVRDTFSKVGHKILEKHRAIQNAPDEKIMGWIGTITASAGTLLALGGGIAGAIATTAGLVTLGSCIGVQLGGNLGKAIGGIFGKTAAKWGERVGVVVGGLAGTGAAVTVGVGLGMSGGWWAAGAAAVTIPLVSKAFSWLGARNDAKKAAAEAAKMQAAQTPPTKPAADSAQPAA